MNILMIDDLLLPDEQKADSVQKTLFLRFSEENKTRRILLAKEFQKLGANVLLARLELSKSEVPVSFEYRETEGISQLFVKIPAKQKSRFLKAKELFCFGTSLFENAPGLSGIFKPDVVISGGILPFSVSSGARIAEGSGSVFITELSCLPSEGLKRFRILQKFSPVFPFLKRSISSAFIKSDAVLGFFPKAAQTFPGAHNLYPMVLPSIPEKEKPSEKAFSLREKLKTFGEGKNFVLAFYGKLEEGFSIEELILSAANFGEKFSLVFVAEGSKKACYRRFVAEKGIGNVFFFEDFPKEEASFILSGANAVFVSEFDFGKGIFPEQEIFWSALGAQKPLIAASEHWSDFFRKAGGAIIVKPRRRDSISLGIKTLLSMAETDREILGLSNRDFYEKNSLQNFAKEYFSLFDNLLSQKENKK